jgi:hypothetical protein
LSSFKQYGEELRKDVDKQLTKYLDDINNLVLTHDRVRFSTILGNNPKHFGSRWPEDETLF